MDPRLGQQAYNENMGPDYDRWRDADQDNV